VRQPPLKLGKSLDGVEKVFVTKGTRVHSPLLRLEAHQVILGGEITQNLLAPGVERMDGVLSGANAERPFDNSTLRYSPAHS
jgi:hypothetical protein